MSGQGQRPRERNERDLLVAEERSRVVPEDVDGQNAPSVRSQDLGALVDALRIPACVIDGSGRALRPNRAWLEIAATDDGTLPSWLASLHPADRAGVVGRLSALGPERDKTDAQCRIRGKAGGFLWFLLTFQLLPDASPQGGVILCVAVDIQSLKLREIDLEQRASFQEDMLNVSVDCIKLISLDGRLLHMNRAGCRALGVPEDSPFGMPWLSLLPCDVHEAGEKALEAVRGGQFSRFAGKSALVGAKLQYWDNMLTPVLGPDGRPTVILCVSRETSAEHEAIEALRQSRERFAIAVRVGGLGIWDYDIRSDELICDDAWYEIMGRDPRRPIRSVAEFRPFIHPDDVERATEVPRTAAELVSSHRDYAMTFRIVRPDGDVRWVRSAACVQTEDGVPVRAVGFVTDVTDAQRGELALRDANRALIREKSSLARQSLEDPVTGLPNRRHLDSFLANLCARAERTGETVCVGMADIDHFKAFNDRYGHLEGDAALRKVAQALQSMARKADFIARYGGEEFVFALYDVADPADVLDRLLLAVEDLAIPHADSPLGRVTVSAGCVVRRSGHALTGAELLKASDQALYEAKLAGRARRVIRFDR